VIELRLIRHAQALGVHGNFARAAESLQLTQPTLTRSIAALESLLGVTLFDRTPKGATPTAFGRVLLERGDTVLRREADLRREIALLAGLEQGSLAIAAGPYMGETSVARAIARVSAMHPCLRIRCASADPAEVLRDVLAERCDIGVAAASGLDRDDRLVVEMLPSVRLYFACRPGHPLTREAAPSIARVLEFPLVTTLLRANHALLAATQGGTTAPQGLDRGQFLPHIQVNTIAMARLIARESDAVVPGTAAILAEDVAAGRLVRLSTDAPAMRTDPGVYYLRGRTLAPSARVFIETLRAVEAEAQAAEAAQLAAAQPVAKRCRAARSPTRPPA
jgi:DNA-binding transcriptional LysR family regulator